MKVKVKKRAVAPPTPRPHYTPKPAPARPDAKAGPGGFIVGGPKNIGVVYQHGYAYIYQLDAQSRLVSKRGRTHLILKASFIECWRFAEALSLTGWCVETYSCTEFGQDVAGFDWSRKYENNPWFLLFKDRLLSTPGA